MIMNISNNRLMILEQIRPDGKIAVNILANNNNADKDSHFVRMISPEEMVSLIEVLHQARMNEISVETVSTLVEEEVDRLKDFK